MSTTFCCIVILLFGIVKFGECTKLEEDLIVTQQQKEILDKFRQIMLPFLHHDYMHEDIFLIRWLRAKDYNIDAATQILRQNLDWRKDNDIDNLDNLDWSYFVRGFAFSVDSVDKKGQPLLIVDQEKWNVREAILSGRRDLLIKWMVKMLEDATKKVRVLQSEGQNVTRWSMVNTLENFNLIQSGCIQCVSIYTAFVNNYEAHYPNMMDQLILVNTPGIFDVVIRLIRPLMTPGTKEALRLMGTNKRQWRAELLQEISSEQLPPEFGGTKTSDLFDE